MRAPRGLTLIEAMVAMLVLLVGALGVVAFSNAGNRLNGDGRRLTRATAVAQDLVDAMAAWDYADPRLANTQPGNDADIGDASFAFEYVAPALAFDHSEADLLLGGVPFLGIAPAGAGPPGANAYLGESGAAGGNYQRFWNVSEADDWNGNGVPDAKRIAVIVRWLQRDGQSAGSLSPGGHEYRRIVLFTSKANPAEQQ
jgi:prepilin-type N-terminal cleavage/methylation domain-containing protein